MASTSPAPERSLCLSCVYVRRVTGRRGQVYLLCRNEGVAAKYPPQPTLRCAGHASSSG